MVSRVEILEGACVWAHTCRGGSGGQRTTFRSQSSFEAGSLILVLVFAAACARLPRNSPVSTSRRRHAGTTGGLALELEPQAISPAPALGKNIRHSHFL